MKLNLSLTVIKIENKKTKENAFKVLTGKSGYGRLDVALSKKQSRVSTLTAAQLSD